MAVSSPLSEDMAIGRIGGSSQDELDSVKWLPADLEVVKKIKEMNNL